MTDRQKFLTKFVSQFYKKAKVKRRSSKNQAPYIARTINNVCKAYFDRRLQFEEEEIYNAFERNKFTLMESGKEEFTWPRYHEGHILVLCDLFIDIDPQSNHDLKLVMKRTYPPNFKPETVKRVDDLKNNLREFWEKNSFPSRG